MFIYYIFINLQMGDMRKNLGSIAEDVMTLAAVKFEMS